MLEQTIDRLSTRDVYDTSTTNILLELTIIVFKYNLLDFFNGTYISVDTLFCLLRIYLRFSRTSIAQGDVRRHLQFITEYAVCYRLRCNKIY